MGLGSDPRNSPWALVKNQGLPRAKSLWFLLCGEKGKWPKQQGTVQVLNDIAGDQRCRLGWQQDSASELGSKGGMETVVVSWNIQDGQVFNWEMHLQRQSRRGT